jgi:transposase
VTIDKAQEAKILRYHFVEHWGVNTIARQLGIHHSSVDRVLALAGLPKAARSRRASMVDPYHPMIIETLEQFPRLSAARLYAMAQARGFTGGASQFRAHVAQLRPRKPSEAYLRLRTLPGEQAQVDWGLCRARHRPHYAESRTMPSTATKGVVKRGTAGIEVGIIFLLLNQRGEPKCKSLSEDCGRCAMSPWVR